MLNLVSFITDNALWFILKMLIRKEKSSDLSTIQFFKDNSVLIVFSFEKVSFLFGTALSVSMIQALDTRENL